MDISYEQAVPSKSLERKVKTGIEEKQEDNERNSQAAAGSKGSLQNASKSREDRVVLIQPFFSSRVLEWAVHLLAVSISIIGICWLRFLRVYWTDESTWTTSWAWAFFGLDGILKALQFITKVHMLLMITSIANITVNYARPRLVDHRGVAFDSFWYTVKFITKDSASISLSIFILGSAILCQLAGLASIGVIQPNVGWWHVPDPYGGQALPVYIQSKKNETFPLTLNSTTIPTSAAGFEWGLDSCLTAAPQTSALACPGYGFEALRAWTRSNFQNHTAPNLPIVESVTGAQRILAAESLGNGTAIAATQSNWVVRLYALFIRYIQLHHLGVVNSMSNPMYTSADSIYAPVVQVQCHTVDSANTNRSGVGFLTNKLTNYTKDGAICHQGLSFNWIDLLSENALEIGDDGQTTKLDSTWRPSIGAVATIPGMLGDQPTSYIVPCIVDARWAASSAWYEPTMSETVISNLSNPSVLTHSTVALNLDGSVPAKTRPRQQWGIGDPINISPNWAELLNALGHLAFTMTSSDGGFVTDSADLMEGAADKVATILSLAIADGLSRITDWSDSLIILDTNGDNITYTYLDAHSDKIDYANRTSFDLEQNTFLQLQVQRYGWAYSWSTLTILSVIVLLMHISMVVWYASYQIRRRGDSIQFVGGKKYI
ncbi:hypothetical protein THAR02_01064 [Trichoderma harzianum]|uniref:Uncharacterized protein n=1 Tax=Trichoderma harzianum TaxID=5544 RepID=A0A0G0A3K4_TRIHA|nr:hypothetical protein THAR02_01064 [Trichoderma harzianum]